MIRKPLDEAMNSRTDMFLRVAFSYVFLLILLPTFVFLEVGFLIFLSAFGASLLRSPSRPCNSEPNFGDHAVPPIALCGAVSLLFLSFSALRWLYAWWELAFVATMVVLFPLMVLNDYRTLKKVSS